EIVPEGFLDDDTRTLGTVRFSQLFGDGFKQNRRNCQIVRWASCAVKFAAKGREGSRVLVVAVNVAQRADQFFEGRRIDSAVLLQTVFCARAKLVEVPSGLGYADDRHVEMSAFRHRLQRRKNLLVREVACG